MLSRLQTIASTVKLLADPKTRKDALEAKGLAWVTGMDFEESYRVVLRGKKEGIEPHHIWLTMTSLNLGLEDAMKAINDPESIW